MGWRPLGDDANISMRAYQSLSLHPPLVGQFSTVSRGLGHILYDPGPLGYWMLAPFVHLVPSVGVLWGSVICCGIAGALAVEAVWSTKYWLGATLVAVTVADLAWRTPYVYGDLVLNPNFGLLFLVASLALAWTVMNGKLGWWPVLVATASVAGQSELIFFVIAVALAVVSPVIGVLLSGWPPRRRWWTVGLVVGAACWIGPLIQEVTGNPGNLTLLARAGGSEPTLGLSFGLRGLGTAGGLSPLWLHRSGIAAELYIGAHSLLWGVVVFALLVAVTVVSWRRKHAGLTSTALLSVLYAVTAVITIATIPRTLTYNLSYLAYFLWPLSILIWVTGLWALAEVVRSLARTRWHRAVGLPNWALTGGVAALVVMVVITGLGIGQTHTNAVGLVYRPSVVNADQIASAVERSTPVGPVRLEFQPLLGWDSIIELFEGNGIAWKLTADGWHPALPTAFTNITGVPYPSRPGWPDVVLKVEGSTVVFAGCEGNSCVRAGGSKGP